MKNYTLIQGNCLEVMPTLADNSIDSIVCDPPYELGFMGKSWDKSGIAYNVEVWREALRVLKPGGHLLAFGGSRTYHRLAVAIEDAGFEIRDQIQWIYGSGFPKSLDVSKAIDKSKNCFVKGGISPNSRSGILGDKNGFDHSKEITFTNPQTEEAKQWEGYGTALKPAHEPICLARKPIEKGLTIAQNVLKYGTGAINIDGCRVEIKSPRPLRESKKECSLNAFGNGLNGSKANGTTQNARFPANVIHDGSDEVEAEFAKYGESKSTKSFGRNGNNVQGITGMVAPRLIDLERGHSDSGTPSRFFKSCKATEIDILCSDSVPLNAAQLYQQESADTPEQKFAPSRFLYSPKTSKADRNEGCEDLPLKQSGGMQGTFDQTLLTGSGNIRTNIARNHHPTVKPTDLMRYLCRLITPPNGTILDPFLGSGSTGKAAIIEGFNFIGIEIASEYLEIAKARIKRANLEPCDIPQRKNNDKHLPLFAI